MAHALVLKAADPAGESSPEMRYLLSDLLLQVRRVFGAATLRVVGAAAEEAEEAAAESGPSGPAPGPTSSPPRVSGARELSALLAGGAFSHVLLLSAADVLLRPPSLARMRDALEAGADGAAGDRPVAAVPRRLADTDLAAGAAVFTLSDFERLEERFLAGGAAPDDFAGAAASPTLAALRPAALLTATALGDLLARDDATAAALAGAVPAAGETPLPAGPGLRPAGLCHEFIDYYGEVRRDVVPYLPDGVETVLEVGCGRGATGRHLQDELGCRVTGVELNPVVGREAARHLHRVVVGDVEAEATVARLDGPYDALLALELFEHLVEPERFLARVRPLVRSGGRIVLSVPNVGHHSVVRDLLAGRWDYLPIGILCYTHYRFYTRRTLADWLARCGFPDARLVAQRTAPPDWLGAANDGEGDADGAGFAGLPVDTDSLSTQGFYVLLDVA